MSREQSNTVNHSNGYQDRHRAYGNRKRSDYEQRTNQNVHHDKPKDEKKPQEDIMDVLEKVIDCEAARIGLTVADIFKTLTRAAATLPDIELDTEFMHLTIDEDGIFVDIPLPSEEKDAIEVKRSGKGNIDLGYDEYAGDINDYDDEEEGLLYDGD